MAGDLPGWDADEDGSRVEALADASTPAAPAAAIVREANQRLYELIAALPADAGGLLCAVYFQGLDLQEAGKQLGISKSWASRLHAKTLRQLARDGQLSHSATDVTDSECPAVASGGYEPVGCVKRTVQYGLWCVSRTLQKLARRRERGTGNASPLLALWASVTHHDLSNQESQYP